MSTQIPNPVSVGNQVEIVTPNSAMAPVGASAQLQQALPAYRYQNPIAFRNRLVQDNDFRSQFVLDLYERDFLEDPTLREKAEENPEKFLLSKRKTEANILNQIYPELSTGEELADAISRRGAELSGTQFDSGKTGDYLKTIQMLPERFEELGLTNNGQLLEEYQRNPNLLGQLIQSDANVREEVYKGRFDIFRATLAQSQNQHGIDSSDPDSVARAFAIFENYGSEGLTKYVNYFQKYDPGRPLSEQDNDVVRAHRFFNSPDFQGRSPSEVVDRFIGSPGSEDGYLSFQPRQMADLNQDIPIDYNNFTRFFYENEGIPALLSAVARGSFDDVTPEGITQIRTVDEDTVNEFMGFFRDNIKTRKTSNTFFDIMRLARDNEGFSMNDLVGSIAVHATPRQGERGALEYIFDPEELPDAAKVAYEALQLDNVIGGGASLFRDAGDGLIAIEPDRTERVQSQIDLLAGYSIVNRERVPVFDNETGQIVGFDTNFNPRLLSFDYPGLLFGRSLQFLSNYIIIPLVSGTAKVMDYLGQDEVSEQLTSSDFFSKFREFGDFNPYEQVGDFFGGGGGALLMTDLGAYIAGSMNIGRAVTATAGAALGAAAGRAATGAVSTRAAFQAGKYLRSLSEPTRFQAQSMKLGNILTRAGKSSHNIFINTEVGSGIIEAAGGARMSMLSNPLLDSLTEKIGLETNIERTYAVSNNLTRIGLDFFSSIGIGFGIDNLWAGTKYVGNLRRVSKGKTARGIKYDPNINDYVKAQEAVFAPEWRRFMHETLNGLQEMPLGSLPEAQSNLVLGKMLLKNPEKIETLEEALQVMNHNMGDLFVTLRDDIEKTVRYWDNELGGKIHYDDAVVLRRTDELYQETVDKIADGIVSVYRFQDPEKRDLVLTMAQRMRDSGPKVMSVPYNTPAGPKYLMDSYEANAVAAKHPNSVITEVVQPNGGVRYSVNIVDEGFWGVAMSDAIMRRYVRSNVEDVIERNMRRLNFGDDMTEAQINTAAKVSTRAEEVIGREVVHSNQRGYIVDFDAREDGLYTIRGIDGVERKAFITDELMGVEPLSVREGISPLEVVQRNAAQRARTYAQATEVVIPRKEPLRLTAGDPARREIADAIAETVDGFDLRRLNEEFEAGLPDTGIISLAREYGVPEMRVRQAVARNLDPQIEEASRQIKRLEKDKRIKNEARRQERIAEQEMRIDELQAQKAEYNQEITDFYGGNTRQLADDAVVNSFAPEASGLAQNYRNAAAKARKMRDTERARSGLGTGLLEPSTGDFRNKFGQGEALIRQMVRESGGKLAAGVASVRKIVMALGSDNNAIDNIGKIAYNKGGIKPLVPANIKKHTAVIFDGDVYMARQSVKENQIKNGTALPSVWIHDKTKGLTMNPYWARVNRNVTTNPTKGTMTPMIRDGHGEFGPVYRVATETDPPQNLVFLNIQKPYQVAPGKKSSGLNLKRIQERNIDSIRTEVEGVPRFEVINHADQVVATRKVSNFEPNFNLRSKDVESQGIC